MTDVGPVQATSPGLFETASDQEATARAIAAAAPTAPERADLSMSSTLDDAVRPVVYRLLRSLGDNKYMLGRRYAEWATGAPTLESAVASAAMAQDELGHARSFYPLLRGFPEGSEEEAMVMEKPGWQEHPTSALASLDARFPNWPGFVAVNFVVDTAFTVFFESAVDSPYEPLRQRARKIIQEEAAHWIHAEKWTQRLAGDQKDMLERGLRTAWPDALAWYGQPDDPVIGALARAGIIGATPDDLRDRLRKRLLPVLERASLTAVAESEIPWRRWDPDARRLSPA